MKRVSERDDASFLVSVRESFGEIRDRLSHPRVRIAGTVAARLGTGIPQAFVVVAAPPAAGADRWDAESLQVFASAKPGYTTLRSFFRSQTCDVAMDLSHWPKEMLEQIEGVRAPHSGQESSPLSPFSFPPLLFSSSLPSLFLSMCCCVCAPQK